MISHFLLNILDLGLSMQSFLRFDVIPPLRFFS